MSRIRRINKTYVIGLLIVLFCYLPVLLLNTNMIVFVHDEFDGEILSYILNARHILDPSFPELFNGIGKTAMTMPALSFILPYFFLSPELGFFINYLVIFLVAYTAMFFCVRYLLDVEWIAAITGVLFAALPFYSVYGLSVMGQPILLLACLMLYDQKMHGLPFALIAAFAFSSSLVLVGYADILLLFVFCLYSQIVKKKNSRYLWYGFAELIAIYGLTNSSLILNILGIGDQYVSHKSEYIAWGMRFKESFENIFQKGLYHATSNHAHVIWPAMIVCAITFILRRRLSERDVVRSRQMATGVALAVGIAVFYAFWHTNTIARLRNDMGGLLVSFQIDRFYWLYPCLWMLLLAYTLYFIRALFNKKWLAYALIALLVYDNGLFMWKNSDIQRNYQAIIEPQKIHTWTLSVHDFFAPELFAEVRDYIGRPQRDYRVISVGLYPSIALYNGFYCLDGYSNNYDIQYKHLFENVIYGELSKNAALKAYFETWGNRCYAFASEIPQQYYVTKDSGKQIHHLSYDFELLKNMGGEYILSAVPITETPGLSFLKKFDREDSLISVYLYGIDSQAVE